ncbi:hypothetical protein K2X33_05820 [bacterium]|nr:hypothetical protein [bacterium]
MTTSITLEHPFSRAFMVAETMRWILLFLLPSFALATPPTLPDRGKILQLPTERDGWNAYKLGLAQAIARRVQVNDYPTCAKRVFNKLTTALARPELEEYRAAREDLRESITQLESLEALLEHPGVDGAPLQEVQATLYTHLRDAHRRFMLADDLLRTALAPEKRNGLLDQKGRIWFASINPHWISILTSEPFSIPESPSLKVFYNLKEFHTGAITHQLHLALARPLGSEPMSLATALDGYFIAMKYHYDPNMVSEETNAKIDALEQRL